MKTVLVWLCLFTLALGVALAADKQPITDGWLEDQVRIRLAGDPEIGGSDIHVQVQERVVTLTGRVDRDKQRSRAEKVARKVKGVASVVNRLTVGPPK
jgi:hyperosmotically inducible periplasmic protein